MSLKVYNGYRMNKLSQEELMEFVSLLRELVLEEYNTRMLEVFATVSANFYKKCVELRKKKENALESVKAEDNEVTRKALKDVEDEIKKELRHIYNVGLLPLNAIMHDIIRGRHKEKSIEKIKEELLGDYFGNLATITEMYIENRCKKTSMDMRSDISFDFDTSITFFNATVDKENKMLFMAHGPVMETILDRALRFTKDTKDDGDELLEMFDTPVENEDKYKMLVEKYGIESYFYTNQTDNPPNVSNEEWENRALDWKSVFRDVSIPVLAGMNIHLMNTETYFNSKYGFDVFKKKENVDKINALLRTIFDIDKMAILTAKESFILREVKDETSASIALDALDKWEKLYKRGDEKVQKLIADKKEELQSSKIGFSYEDMKDIKLATILLEVGGKNNETS